MFVLLASIIAVIVAGSAQFVVRTHRADHLATYAMRLNLVAAQVQRLMLWDDRVAIRDLLGEFGQGHDEIVYVFVERDHQPYVSTFDDGVPKGLLGLHGQVSEDLSVRKLVDQRTLRPKYFVEPKYRAFLFLMRFMSNTRVEKLIESIYCRSKSMEEAS